MAAVAGRMVAGQLMKQGGQNKQGSEDPFKEKYEVEGRGGRKITKKRKRAPPPLLNAKEAKVLSRVRKRAYWLDMGLFNLCGLKFGWSSVLGLIPVVGDFVDALFALMLIRTCTSIEPKLPGNVVASMTMNLILDFLVGLVPLLGDLADAAYKCNTKNYVLLEKELKKRSNRRLEDKGKTPDPNAGVGLMDLEEEAQGEESDVNEPDASPPQYAPSSRHPRRPDQAYNPSPYAARGGNVDLEAGR